ncbi:unnamed protein product, partial [Owenia fusiformis]
ASLPMFLSLSNIEAPTEFLKPLEDVSIMEGETAIFECEVSKPRLNAKWFKDGKEIKSTKRIKTTMEATKHFLTIKDCVLDDEAKYSVKLLEATSEATLLVEEEPVTITLPLKDKTCIEHESVSFTAE